MESFNRTLNNGQQETSFGKGLGFAILGMILGIISYVIIGGIFAWRGAWISGVALGGAISFGWHLGKGPVGVKRQISIIILSIIGGIFGIILGYALFFYNALLDYGYFWIDFIDALDVTIYAISFDYVIIIDILLMTGIAIGTSWRRFNKNDILGESDDNDLEVLDNKSTRTEMEELLGEDIPTLRLDETWKCHACGAENRNIVNSCEYCGANK